MSSTGSAAFEEARRTMGAGGDVEVVGRGFLTSALAVSDLVTQCFSTLGSALARVMAVTDLGEHTPRVDRGLGDTWFGQQAETVGWEPPSPWDPLSGTFRTEGSWLRTHANAPRHRAALLRVLGLPADTVRDSLAEAIGAWTADDLERAIVESGGAAAALRTEREWSAREAGSAVAAEPLVAREEGSAWEGTTGWAPVPTAPLAGIRVLDLTRVIAGPASTQVLAGLGADVLRVDPPDWDEPAVLPLVMAGKRSTRIDARTPAGREVLLALLADADVLVHGYRAGAIDHLGLDAAARRSIRPGLVEVAERAYGWSGPWAGRRGFDSLVQFSTGIAHRGMVVANAAEPVSLPVQALDWATGYLAAAAALAGLADRAERGVGSTWHLSLARTAAALLALEPAAAGRAQEAAVEDPMTRIATARGAVVLAASPIVVGQACFTFDRVTERLGEDPPTWRDPPARR